MTLSPAQTQNGVELRRRRAARWQRWEPLLFVLLILIHLAPIWAFRYLPTTDGAAHVASADVMRLYHDPSLSVFREYYYISQRPIPNLVGHLLLMGLLFVAKPVIAEKILVSLIVAGLPLAMRYAARSIRRRGTAIAYLAFPLVYSFLLAQGFYNFCLSLAVLLGVVGYWIRNRDRLGWGRGIVLLLMLGVLYVCHLFALALACGILGLLAVWTGVLEWWRGGGVVQSRGEGTAGEPAQSRRLLSRGAVGRVVVTVVAMLPWVGMAAVFKPVTSGYEEKGGAWSIKENIVDLLQFSTMVSYRKNEVLIASGIAGLILATALYAGYVRGTRGTTARRHDGARGRRLRWRFQVGDVLLIVALGLLVLYFKAQDGNSIHFYVPPRTMFCFYLVTALWLAGQPLTRRVRGALIALATLLALGMVASHTLKYREFAPQIREFVSAGERMQPNTTFLPLIFAPQGRNAAGKPSSVHVAPFYMVSGYIAAERRVVDLRNYEAKTDHFPVRFRDNVNPYVYLAIGDGLDRPPPPRIDLERYAKQGGQVNYILLWGMTEQQRSLADTKALMKQIEARYRRVVLPGAKWTELWERRPETTPATRPAPTQFPDR